MVALVLIPVLMIRLMSTGDDDDEKDKGSEKPGLKGNKKD